MEAFYYLNYIVFEYYKRKKDSAPLSASFFLPILLISFNIFSIIFWVSIFFDFTLLVTKKHIIVFFLVLATKNYFILYHKHRYRNVFEIFEKDKSFYRKKYSTGVKIYIVLTIIFFLSALVAADLRVDGQL